MSQLSELPTPSPQIKAPLNGWCVFGILLGAIVMAVSLAGPLLGWPLMDESTYVLQAREMAQGLLPYRDFYDFVTPGSQWIGSLLIRLNGFSLLSLRLYVVMGWLVQIVLLYNMGKNYLSKGWLVLLVAFLWLTDSRYPVFQHHFWSGLSAIGSIYLCWSYLQSLYNGRPKAWLISFSGVLCAMTFWITQSLGVMLAIGLLAFSLLHSFLHERQEKGANYGAMDNHSLLRRWFSPWVKFGVLPGLAFHGLCILTLMLLGIWPDFMRDTFQWLAGGHYNRTSILGYYPTFHQEFITTIRPFLDGVGMPAALLFIFRFPIAFQLFLIGLLPVIGILGLGYSLPNRFHYRLLQRQDDELLLLWLGATAMIVSTMSYSTSMHITSNGGLAFLLGAIAIDRFLLPKPKLNQTMKILAGLFCGSLLLGAISGSLTMLLLGSWLPPTRAIPQPQIYVDSKTSATQLLALLDKLNQAAAAHRSIFVFCQSPTLYLASGATNATRYSLVIPQYTSSVQMAEVMRDLERKPPLYIVDDNTVAYISKDPRFAQFAPTQLTLPEIGKFLSAHYTMEGQYGIYTLYRHQDTP